MRLQVAIHRHTLPPVNIIFATGTGPASRTAKESATIYNLLEDLNDLVPLESLEGYWGLEDYVVEVAATADQEATYECLHYLPLKSILREDDEVIVRPLGSDDLRAWRRGGRLQITRNGRHLIDGVVFSKRWLKTERGRPGVSIPPRKRMRLLFDEDEDEDEEEEEEVEAQKENLEPVLLPAINAAGPTVGNNGPNKDAITLREIFEDARSSEDELSDVDGDELQLLLKDAADLEDSTDASGLLESQLKARTRLGKRKRQSDDDLDDSDEASFEGFESPARSRVLQDVSHQFKGMEDDGASEADSLLEVARQRELLKKQANIVDDDDDSSDSSDEDFSSTSSTSESGDESSGIEGASNNINQVESDGHGDSSDEDSSSTTSSESEDESGGQDFQSRKPTKHTNGQSFSSSMTGRIERGESSDSGVSTSSSENTDSTGSSSHDDLDSDTSSSSSSSRGGKLEKKNSAPNAAQPQSKQSPANTSRTTSTGNKAAESAPGTGSLRTRANNIRVKRRKRLASLKSQGLLPVDADFGDLATYDGAPPASEGPSIQEEDELEAARKRALAQLTGQSTDKPSPQREPLVAQSIEPQHDVQQPAEEESPVIQETQDEQGQGERHLPLRLRAIPDVLFKQIVQLDEPERTRKWLGIFFEASEGGMVSQDAIFATYSRSFKDHDALAGSSFLPCIFDVFNKARVLDPFDPRTAIQGIRLRDSMEEAADSMQRVVSGEPEKEAVLTPMQARRAEAIFDNANEAALSTEHSVPSSESLQKRAKLDVSATRRLIFGALGSRNPKTTAQAQAVRQKLAGTIRQPKSQPSLPSVELENNDDAIDSEHDWQNKLLVSAVECEKDVVSYPPPPFPFVQHWHKSGKAKRSSVQMEHVSSLESQTSPSPLHAVQIDMTISAAKNGAQNGSVPESRTVSFDRDDRDGMPIPSDFNALAALDRSQALPGAVIAFKELEIDMVTFQPRESDYKVARVDRLHDDSIELTLATRYRIQVANSPDEATPGEKLYSQFVIQSGPEDDGIREILYSNMKGPKLIEPSPIQVPSSHNANAADGSQPNSDMQDIRSQVVAESVIPQPDQPMNVDSPHRPEILTIMEEDGFNPVVGEFLPNSDVSTQVQDRTGSQSPGMAQDTSPLYPDDSVLSQVPARVSSPLIPTQDDQDIMADDIDPNRKPAEVHVSTSAPSNSQQAIVDYPSIPQTNLASDAPEPVNGSGNSSSHQDAQRQSPPLQADTTLIASEQRDKMHPIVDGSVLMPESDLPASSQPAETGEDEMNSDAASDNNLSPRPKSFLGVGLDGSFHVSDDDYSSDSGDSLPSLRELTSSQKRKILPRATKAATKPAPPVVKRGGLRSSGASKVYSPPLLSDDDPDEAEMLRTASQVSQRDGRPPRLSQMPQGSQVVDLTVSSDAASPTNSDGEFQVQASKNRIGQNGGRSGGRVTRRSATNGASQGSLGIGQRKLLTSKKTRA